MKYTMFPLAVAMAAVSAQAAPTLALSEVSLLGEAKPGCADFKLRAADRRRRLTGNGVNCAPIE